MAETISLDFGKPIPLFPLSGTVLLPHAVQALHVFEPRYRQMMDHCIADVQSDKLLTAGPIALASFLASSRMSPPIHDPSHPPPLRSAVCVGKIVQQQRLEDGKHNVLIQGVCRARIRAMLESDGKRLYRMAMLEPIERVTEPPPSLPGVRGALKALLQRPRLQRLAGAEVVLEWIARKDVPTHALLELVGFTLMNDERVRYRLLAEPDPKLRATLIRGELGRLDALVAKAEEQAWRDWPKGLSWN
ncbi:MAG: LON peptidase substrate-binding domain-containing protein [Phycisphaerae bacterium]|nr:LON peptidase substrate-binding domain-containing protein [Phycisphaerae bacterium]